jgi:hypothetical protein
MSGIKFKLLFVSLRFIGVLLFTISLGCYSVEALVSYKRAQKMLWDLVWSHFKDEIQPLKKVERDCVTSFAHFAAATYCSDISALQKWECGEHCDRCVLLLYRKELFLFARKFAIFFSSGSTD